ncbi:MAG: branched-chain amino acid ABC transporter permease, partial [Aurantimonas coralicida]
MTSLDHTSEVRTEGTDGAAVSPDRKPGQRDLSTIGFVLAGIAVVGLLVAPFYVYPVFIMSVLCFALFAIAFNLLLGYVGLLSFGHAAFFGGAAYFTAHAAKVWGWEPLSAILLGAGGAGLIGLLVGYLAIRRQGIYFAMVTL